MNKTVRAQNEFVVGKHNIGWISPRMEDKLKGVKVGKGKPLQYQDLTKNMYDHEIKSELGAQEVEYADILLAMDSGQLLANGYVNIFYVLGFAVRVSWSAVSRLWFVNDWELDDDYWDSGRRVFSRNFSSVPLDSALASSDSLPLELKINEVQKFVAENWDGAFMKGQEAGRREERQRILAHFREGIDYILIDKDPKDIDLSQQKKDE